MLLLKNNIQYNITILNYCSEQLFIRWVCVSDLPKNVLSIYCDRILQYNIGETMLLLNNNINNNVTFK